MNKIKKFPLQLAILLLLFQLARKKKVLLNITLTVRDSRLKAGRHIDSSHLTIELTCFSITKSDKVMTRK